MTFTPRIVASAVLVSALAAAPGGAAKLEPLRTRVEPTAAMAPAYVRVSAFVEPARENRGLEIAIDSSTYYSRSTIDLEGADAARQHTVEFRAVPEGEYDIRVTLTGAGGAVRAVASDRLVVVGKQ